FDAVNVGLGLPNPVTLTIVDNESFNEPAGSADVAFFESTQANGPVFAIALQKTNNVTDGRIVVAGDFTDFNQVVRNRLARLLPNGNLDTSFDPGPGANGAIRTLAAEPDGKLLIGGFFSQVLGTNRNGIARLNSDGTLDSSFNPGAGADNPVYKVVLQPDDRILVGGGFSTFNSISRPGIVRLNTNGTVDTSFSTGGGPDNTVFAIAQQTDGKVLIGGDFTSVNSVSRSRIARLNTDGSVDLSFNPGQGMNASVRAILVLPDGDIVVGGSFTSVRGVARNYLARLKPDGSVDTDFLAGLSGANNAVFDLAQQVDGKILVVGDFTLFNGVTRNRLTRLNADGTTDPSINFGNGANSFVASVVIQPDRKFLIGGGFTTYDDRPRLRIARIHGGSLAGSGQLEFSQPQYVVQESITNAVVTVRRRGGTAGQVGVNYRAYNGTALDGRDFTAVSGTLTFAPAETRQSFVVPVIDNFIPDGDRFANLELVPGTFTGGASKGAQPSAILAITDNEGSISYSASNFSVSEGIPSGLATILVRRQGGTNNAVSVNFATTNGTATALQDYFPTNGLLNFAAGETSKSFHVRVINDTTIEGNETVILTLGNPSHSNVLDIATSTLLILDNDFGPGQIQFSTNTFS
ncbi:MAG TPA: Calx-beta domain-containing protein, partial [Verrucomicrobiae bacterium]|nr:Calx-beta domain-containing protein [Verrucomicrobiae bacterium]